MIILIAFLATTVIPASYAQEYVLPAPGTMISLSTPFTPAVLTGVKVHPDNPFEFDFILNQGNTPLSKQQVKVESTRLIKYFLSSITVPQQDLWVNLSPSEKDKITPQAFGQTEMGRDLLAQDYILKQLTASLMYPEAKLGKKFWDKIYQEAFKNFGVTDIPVDTFNKVWIVPEKAVVYENAEAGTAYVVESKLKVMLEEDYFSRQSSVDNSQKKNLETDHWPLATELIRQIIIPALEKEVNQGKTFAKLRQVYHSLILATWYKKKIKDSIFSQVYSNKNKISGITIDNPDEKEKIYQQYLKAFKKGVYNYIKEDYDPAKQEIVPRKYFSGGMTFFDMSMLTYVPTLPASAAKKTNDLQVTVDITPQKINPVNDAPISDFRAPAMTAKNQEAIPEYLTQARLKKIGEGLSSFEGAYEDTRAHSPLQGYIVKIPYTHVTKQELEFAKKNMGGLLADFNILENISIEGVNYPFVVLQKKLKVFEGVDHLADVQKYGPLLAAQEKNLIEEMVTRGIYYPEALSPRNYGFDEETHQLYLIDFGTARFIGRDDAAFNPRIFKPVNPDLRWRKGSYHWEFYKDVLSDGYFDRIGVLNNDDLYELWATRASDNYPVPDIVINPTKGSNAVDRAMASEEREALFADLLKAMPSVDTVHPDWTHFKNIFKKLKETEDKNFQIELFIPPDFKYISNRFSHVFEKKDFHLRNSPKDFARPSYIKNIFPETKKEELNYIGALLQNVAQHNRLGIGLIIREKKHGFDKIIIIDNGRGFKKIKNNRFWPYPMLDIEKTVSIQDAMKWRRSFSRHGGAGMGFPYAIEHNGLLSFIVTNDTWELYERVDTRKAISRAKGRIERDKSNTLIFGYFPYQYGWRDQIMDRLVKTLREVRTFKDPVAAEQLIDKIILESLSKDSILGNNLNANNSFADTAMTNKTSNIPKWMKNFNINWSTTDVEKAMLLANWGRPSTSSSDHNTVRLMDEIGIEPGEKVLSIGPETDRGHLIFSAIKGAVVDVNQPQEYLGRQNLADQIETSFKIIARDTKENETMAKRIKGINAKKYPLKIQDANIPSSSYDYLVLLNVLDGVNKEESWEIAQNALRVIRDGGIIFLSALSYSSHVSKNLLFAEARDLQMELTQIAERGNVIALEVQKPSEPAQTSDPAMFFKEKIQGKQVASYVPLSNGKSLWIGSVAGTHELRIQINSKTYKIVDGAFKSLDHRLLTDDGVAFSEGNGRIKLRLWGEDVILSKDNPLMVLNRPFEPLTIAVDPEAKDTDVNLRLTFNGHYLLRKGDALTSFKDTENLFKGSWALGMDEDTLLVKAVYFNGLRLRDEKYRTIDLTGLGIVSHISETVKQVDETRENPLQIHLSGIRNGLSQKELLYHLRSLKKDPRWSDYFFNIPIPDELEHFPWYELQDRMGAEIYPQFVKTFEPLWPNLPVTSVWYKLGYTDVTFFSNGYGKYFDIVLRRPKSKDSAMSTLEEKRASVALSAVQMQELRKKMTTQYNEILGNWKGQIITDEKESLGAIKSKIEKIRDKRTKDGHKITLVAIDGSSGTFKTTTAQKLAGSIENAIVISSDLFVGDRNKRYKKILEEFVEKLFSLKNEEIYYNSKKFQNAVLKKLALFDKSSEESKTWTIHNLYNKTDHGKLTRSKTITVKKGTVVIIEGNYLMKRWRNAFDLTICMTANPETSNSRRVKRDSHAQAQWVNEMFWRMNTPSYNQYLRRLQGENFVFDFTLRTDSWDQAMEADISDQSSGDSIQNTETLDLEAGTFKKGGIDFTADQTPLEVKNSGEEIQFHLNPAMLEQLQNAPGFVPVIINIQPLTNLPAFLGFIN